MNHEVSFLNCENSKVKRFSTEMDWSFHYASIQYGSVLIEELIQKRRRLFLKISNSGQNGASQRSSFAAIDTFSLLVIKIECSLVEVE